MLVYPCLGRYCGYDHYPQLRIEPDIQSQGPITCLTDLQSNLFFPFLFPLFLSFSFLEFLDSRSDSTFSKGQELFLEFPNCGCMAMFRCEFNNFLLFFSSKLIVFFYFGVYQLVDTSEHFRFSSTVIHSGGFFFKDAHSAVRLSSFGRK